MQIHTDDLFFTSLVCRYVDKNPRFLRRDWLAKQLDEKLQEPGKQFVLLTAKLPKKEDRTCQSPF